MEYREITEAPEDKKVRVVWGEERVDQEHGIALRIGSQWYIHGLPNPYANGMPCAAPDGWLPEDPAEWTKAEKRLCDILALHPEV